MLSRSDSGGWQRTSPVAIAIFVGRSAKSGYDRYGAWSQTVAAIGVTAFLLRNPQYTVLTLTAVLIIVVLVGGLRYWFFRFRIEDDRIFIRQGVLNRTAVDLPFDRVQGINVNRGPLERILGLVTVVIDTPGSVSAEGQLPAVSPAIAERLFARVAAHQGPAPDAAGAAETLAAAGAPEAAGAAEAGPDGGPDDGPEGRARQLRAAGLRAPEERGEVLHRLANRELLRLGLAKPGASLYYLAALILVGRQVDVVVDQVVGAFETVSGAVAGPGVVGAATAVTVLVLGFVVLVLATRVGSAIVRYHDFTLWREGRSYRSQSGLATRREVAVGVHKVQQILVNQSAVYRWFGRYRLAAPTIGSSLDADEEDDDDGGADDADVLRIPWADGALVETVRSGILRGEGERLAMLPEDGTFRRVSRLYIRAAALRFLLVWVPLVVVGLFFLAHFVSRSWRGGDLSSADLGGRYVAIWADVSLVWVALALVLALPVGWLRWRARAYMHTDHGISCRYGLLGRGVQACLFRKAQGVTVSRSPLERRHGLATLEVETASGDVTVPYIEHAAACRLRDYIVYKAESSQRRWH